MDEKVLIYGATGPRQLKNGKTYILAIAKNKEDETSRVEITGPEAYVFTMECLFNLIQTIKSNSEFN